MIPGGITSTAEKGEIIAGWEFANNITGIRLTLEASGMLIPHIKYRFCVEGRHIQEQQEGSSEFPTCCLVYYF